MSCSLYEPSKQMALIQLKLKSDRLPYEAYYRKHLAVDYNHRHMDTSLGPESPDKRMDRHYQMHYLLASLSYSQYCNTKSQEIPYL